MIDKVLKNIENIGRKIYQTKYMVRKEVLEKCYYDDIEALKFFVGACFIRNRRDELSDKYHECANTAVEDCKNDISKFTSEEIIGRILRHYKKEVKEKLRYKINPIDIAVLWGIFEELLPSIQSANVVKWTVDSLKGGTPLKDIYDNLKIPGVGDKLRGVYLRDIILGLNFDLKNIIREQNDYHILQPIDTQVKKVTEILWPELKRERRKKIEKLKEKIICGCQNAGVNPLIFNQGAFTIGAHPKDVIDYVKERPEKVTEVKSLEELLDFLKSLDLKQEN